MRDSKLKYTAKTLKSNKNQKQIPTGAFGGGGGVVNTMEATIKNKDRSR